MIRILFSVFTILHGLVHLLYLGQSARFFELKPGLTWPDGSWAISKFLGDESTRMLASVFMIIAALTFVMGGVGFLTKQTWWRLITIAAAVISSIVYLLLWDSSFESLADNGWVGIAINVAFIVAMVIFDWLKL